MKSIAQISILILLSICLAIPNAQAKKKKKESSPGLTEKQLIELKHTFFEANKQKMLDNYQEAAELFQRCIEIYPEHAASLYELAGIRMQQTRLAEATFLLEAAVEIEPKNKWYRQALAGIYETVGEYEKGADQVRALIEVNPDNIALYESLANMYLYQNDLKSAMKVYNETEEKFGVNEMTSTQKQKIYVAQGKNDKALEEANKLVETYPSVARYYTALAELYFKTGDKEAGVATYEKLLAIDPDNALVQLSMATYYYEAGNVEEAQKTMKLAFANPDLEFDSKARILFNHIAYRGVPEGMVNPFALELAETLTETHPEDAKAFGVYADLLYQSGKINPAKKNYLKSLDINKDQFLVWSQVLIIDSDKADWQGMYDHAAEAVDLFPTQASFYYFQGVAALQLDKNQDCIDILEMGLGLIMDNRELKAQFYTYLGDAYYNLDNYDKSFGNYDQALKLDPNNMVVLNNYSYYLSLLDRDLEKAKEMSKRTVENEPESATFLDTYAWILYRMGDYEEAKKYMGFALNHGGRGEAVILEHYGDILYQLGEKDEARNYWKKASQAGEGSEFLNQKLETGELHEE
ncbi:tetratricopeptide repeat protein [bacterium SCSIO 12741]|nr:tetratricopeptide repeat protein [bacterium SCSIO 12741]